jgi:OmcA/MtrC family decaheme c-type cytochrome
MPIKKIIFLLGTLIVATILLAACAGPAGETGPAGPMGPQGPVGPEGPPGPAGVSPTLEPAALTVNPETCQICHPDVGEKQHQEVYDQYTDKSTLALTIDSVRSVSDGAGGFNSTMTFTILKNGLPFIDDDGLPSLNQKRFYSVQYDGETRMFTGSQAFGDIKAVGNGVYTASAASMAYAPENETSEVYGYVAADVLDTEGATLYSDVSNAALAFGDVNTYESAANVAGCEKCHGTPYMKHGYRAAAVNGVPDFAACKTCHYDDRTGGHQDWQILVDNPARYAEIFGGDALTDAEKTQYAYTANVMNDTHMSHAMEFPYPQSMSNCATCHEGKLDMILTDANFKLETCKSCHPVTGPEEGTEANRAPALASIMPHDITDAECNTCHMDGGIAPVFSSIHTGYNKVIYADAEGTKYTDVFTVTIDEASLDNNLLTFKFSATKNGDLTTFVPADIIPTVMVGLYGYDTKDFIVSPHSRDADGNRLLEFPVDGTSTNPRFTVVSAANGSWEVTADLSTWAGMMADGSVKRAEIAVMPLLANVVGEIDSRENGETDDTAFALNAPSRTFDLTANAFDDGFYSDIVNVADGCNTCHDALATTFHSPDRGGNIVVCRLCHVPSSGGSHLEMQSRSIDSYVHSIHSFEAFDIGGIDFSDPVAAMRYELHIEHSYPNFTIKNCESCHNEGMFNVPDSNMSLPGVLSPSATVSEERNIGDVPSYVTGPTSRACGGCHRAMLIKEDDAAGLTAFNLHAAAGGYMVPVDADTSSSTFDTIVQTIMSFFKK